MQRQATFLSTAFSLAAALSLLGSAAAQTGDECLDALPATTGLTPFDTSSATTSAPAFDCDAGSGADLWFAFTPTLDGPYTIETCTSGFDTVLEVWSGPCASPVLLGCSDDDCGTRSQLAPLLTAGVPYLVRVGGFNGETGVGELDIERIVPVNDECDGALPAFVGFNTFDNNTATTSSPPFACEPIRGEADVWFDFLAPATGPYTFQTCGNGLTNSVIEVIEGSCQGAAIGCNDDFCGLQSRVTVAVVAGQTYKVRIGGWNGSEGVGELTIIEGSPSNQIELVAHYKLDETSGNVAIDSSGNGNDGIMQNVQLGLPGVDPAKGSSAYFDGVSSVIDILPSASLDGLRSDLSVSAWFLVDDTPNFKGRLFGNQGPLGSWSVAVQSDTFSFTTHAIQEYRFLQPYAFDTWHHVVWVFDQFDDVSMYLDGQLVDRVNGLGASNVPSSTYHIGAWNPGFSSPEFFEGQMDEVQVYSGVLSPSDVQTLFADSCVTVDRGPIGDGYCTPVPNSTGVPSLASAVGSTILERNDVTLRASQMRPGSFGFFVTSQTLGFVPNAGGSSGNLCVVGDIGRFSRPGEVLQANAAGEFELPIDLGTVPTPFGVTAVMPGETWYYQCWHRDVDMGVSTSNYTQGLRVQY